MKKKGMKKSLLPLIIVMVAMGGFFSRANDDKPLQYEVQVTAQLLPVTALDQNDNPVLDLNENDIKLYVNGKETEIISFIGYNLTTTPEAQVTERTPERLNVIIVDTPIAPNSPHNFTERKNALQLARGIVKNSGAGDAFIIFESSHLNGLKYLIGPEKDKTKLYESLNPSGTLHSGYTFTINKRTGTDGSSGNSVDEMNRAIIGGNIADSNINNLQQKYGEKRLMASLTWLKYALKTVTTPKNVYLISKGLQPATSGLTEYINYHEKFLKRIAITVNLCGAMLYTLNPSQVPHRELNNSLKYLAAESGGKYFHGGDKDKILKKLQHCTSAYYEIAFYPPSNQTDLFKVSLKSNRKGVKFSTVKYSEKPTSYKELTGDFKRMFVINTIIGGNWSHMVAVIKKVTPRYFNMPKNPENSSKSTALKYVELPIPTEMKNRKCEIYLVNIDKLNEVATIGLREMVVTDKVDISLPVDITRTQYLVLVEPEKPFCIFAEII